MEGEEGSQRQGSEVGRERRRGGRGGGGESEVGREVWKERGVNSVERSSTRNTVELREKIL